MPLQQQPQQHPQQKQLLLNAFEVDGSEGQRNAKGPTEPQGPKRSSANPTNPTVQMWMNEGGYGLVSGLI